MISSNNNDDTALLDAALYYASMGLPVFPCQPRTKKPACANGFYDATTDKAIIRAWWSQNPDANVAMPTGKASDLVAVDVDPRHGGDESLVDLTASHSPLPETAEALTGGGGRHIFVQHPGGRVPCSQSAIAPGVDIKGDGGYVVLPPSVHPDGGSYAWEFSSDIADVRPAPCPEWLVALIRDDTEETPHEPTSRPTDANAIPSGQRNSALASLGGGMRRMGMSEGEICAALLATNQARCEPPLDGREVERIAASVARYEPDGITVALAENHYGQMFADDEADDGPRTVDPGPVPDDLLRIPGFVSEVMDHSLETAPYPNPTMAFCGALALQSFLAARKVRDPGDNRTNLYLLGLAYSSAGKDWPRKVNTKLLWQVGLGQCVGDKFASGEGIQDALLVTPAMLFQTDEIDGMLQSICRSREARYENIMGTLLTMYTSSATVFPMRRKAGKEAAGAIDQPSLTVFGTAIPTHYYEALSARMLTNGFFARMIVLEAGKRGNGQEPSIRDLPERVIATARWWAGFEPSEGRGNLAGCHPVPATVEQTPEARRLVAEVREHAEHEYSQAEDRGDDVGTTVWGRASENIRKLALVYAVSENALNPVIGEDAVRWASRFIEHQTLRMLFMASEHVSSGEHDSRCKELIRVLRQWRDGRGDGWMPFWRISRKLPWGNREHEEVRTTLLSQRMIEYSHNKTTGRPQRLYRLR